MPLPLLTVSRLQCARRCQREHRFRYWQGYQPRSQAESLRFGTLIHKGLEAWWRATGEDRQEQAIAAIWAARPNEMDAARALAMLLGYHTRWADEAIEVLAVEREFRIPLINPATGAPSRTWDLAGKMDGIARLADGRILFVEHKTTSESAAPGSDYWRRLRLDGQVSIYYAAAQLIGFDASACLYDVLRKPAIRPLKATAPEARRFTKDGRLYSGQRLTDETPEEHHARCIDVIAEEPNSHFARAEVPRLDREVTEAMADTWQIARVLRENDIQGFYPRNPDACVRYGRICGFFGVCTGEASIEDPELFERLENVHPELSAGISG